MRPREILKTAARWTANVAAAPFLILHVAKVPILGKDRALEGSSQLLALLPGLCGQYIRRAFLAWTIAECHPSATICFGTILSKTTARIGPNVYVGPYCSLGSVTVAQDVLIATSVHLLSGARIHGIADLSRPIRDQPGEIRHITIGAGSWIGTGSVIMADVGADSAIGAGAVVTRAIASNVIAAGIPARTIRTRTEERESPVDPQN